MTEQQLNVYKTQTSLLTDINNISTNIWDIIFTTNIDSNCRTFQSNCFWWLLKQQNWETSIAEPSQPTFYSILDNLLRLFISFNKISIQKANDQYAFVRVWVIA